MLKFFYKTLLVSLLCGSLMLLDFSYKGISLNNLRAESVKTEGLKDGNLMATLTMTAVGLLASRLWTCTKTTDMLIAAAGGAAFIAGEVMAAIKLKGLIKDIETSIQRDKEGNINQEQKAALERLKKSYEDAKDTAKLKKTLQQAAAAAFAAAAIVAYTSYSAHKAAVLACTTAIAAAVTACNGKALALSSNPITAYLALPYTNGAANAAAAAKTTAADSAYSLIPGPSNLKAGIGIKADATKLTTLSASSTCPLTLGSSTFCKAEIVINKAGRGICISPPGIVSSDLNFLNKGRYAYGNQPNIQNSAMENFFKLFISSAHADLFSPLGLASTAAITFLLATSNTLGITIDTFLYSPMNRAIVWGILGGLVFAATSATDNVISQIDSNIQKIDAILNGINSLENGTTTSNVQQPVTGAVNKKAPTKLKIDGKKYEEVDISKSPQGQLPCFTGPDPKNCPSFEDVNKDLPDYNLLDKNTQNQVSSMLKTLNGFNGTSKISPGAFDGANQLGNSSNALFASMEKKKAELKEKLKKSKSKIDPDALGKKFSDQMQAIVKKNLKNSSAKAMLGEIFGTKNSLMLAGDENNSATDGEKASGSGQAIMPTAYDLNGAGAALDSQNAGLDALAAKKGPTAEEIAAYNKATKSGSMDDFEIKNDDINKNSDVSIFDLISDRYQKSGYPRLFKEKAEAIPEPTKKQ